MVLAILRLTEASLQALEAEGASRAWFASPPSRWEIEPERKIARQKVLVVG